MNQSVAINDSQERHSQSQEEREKKCETLFDEKEEMRQKIIGMEMEIERQTLVYIDEKMKWDRQRNRMQKELERCKFLSYKRPTNNSSSQTTSESQGDDENYTTPHKCSKCNKSFLDEDSVKYHEDVYCDKRQNFDGIVCKQRFSGKANFDSHDAIDDASAGAKKEQLLKHLQAVVAAISLPSAQPIEASEKAIREEYEFKYKKCAKPKEGNAQKLGQNMQMPIFFEQSTTAANVEETAKALQDKLRVSNSKEPSSTPALAEPEPKPQARIPIEDHVRKQLRERFASMLENHSCKNLKCSVIAFKNYVRHANDGCFYGREDCTWYICERIHARSKHLKKCKDRMQCKICLPYVYFNEAKLEGLMTILEKRCSLIREHTSLTRDAVMATVARLAVNYGLVGDDKKIEDTKTQSSSDSSSLDEEGISEDWELVESELLTHEGD